MSQTQINKYARIIIIIAASFLLIFASYKMLFAQDAAPPTPFVYEHLTPEGTTTFYELDYFLPYAKRITTNYSYINGGGLTAFTWTEPTFRKGVRASYTYPNAAQINEIQVIVTTSDNKVFTFNPIRVGLNVQHLPLVQQNGAPNNSFPNLPDGTLTIFEDKIGIDVRIRDYDWMVIRFFSTTGQFYEITSFVDQIGNIPTTETFDHVYGYMWREDTLQVDLIQFTVIHVEVAESAGRPVGSTTQIATPFINESETAYVVDYELPYARRITINHNLGSIVRNETSTTSGVMMITAIQKLPGLDVNSIEFIIELSNGAVVNLKPIILKHYQVMLPLVQVDGSDIAEFVEPVVLTGTIRIRDTYFNAEVDNFQYDRLRFQVYGNVMTRVNSTVMPADFDVNWTGCITKATGGVWDNATLAYATVRFEVIDETTEQRCL